MTNGSVLSSMLMLIPEKNEKSKKQTEKKEKEKQLR